MDKIKVKDLISHLETLDQEKLIYVNYDFHASMSPIPSDELDEDGNYQIIAW